MQSADLKDQALILRRVGADLKRCRAGHMALHGLAALDDTGEALAITMRELQAAAEALAKDARAYAKALTDLAAQLSNA